MKQNTPHVSQEFPGGLAVKDLALLWLWFRPAAVAPIQPLAWELPYALGVILKSKKKKKAIHTTLDKKYK